MSQGPQVLSNSNATESRLGWSFLGAVETGRYRVHKLSEGEAGASDTRQFWHEVERCQYEVLPGPGTSETLHRADPLDEIDRAAW